VSQETSKNFPVTRETLREDAHAAVSKFTKLEKTAAARYFTKRQSR